MRDHGAPLAAALIVLAVGALSIWAVPFRLDTDDLLYLGLASSHAAGAGLTVPGLVPPAGWYFPPGWPLLLAWLFGAGLRLAAATWCASAISAACLAGAAAIWTSVFARRVGPAWGLLSALWCTLAFPTLLAGTSASTEGAASLLTALLALLSMREGPAAALPPVRRAGALGLAMAGLALLRTQLVLLWPLALWHVRTTLKPRQIGSALVLGAGLTVAVTRLTAVSGMGTGYLSFMVAAWHGGLSSPGAAALRGNLSANLWNSIAWLAVSPLPYARSFVHGVGPLGLRLLALGACLALAWTALREREHGLPALAAAPLALALPFLAGYPYAMTPRFLVPAAPIIGYFAVAWLRRTLGGTPRVAVALGGAWLLFGVAWWAHLAPRYHDLQRESFAEVQRVVDGLRTRGDLAAPLCAEAPETLWAAAPDVGACLLVTPVEYVLSDSVRQAAVLSRLRRAGARCLVRVTAAEGIAPLPLAAWGYRPVLRTPRYSSWCTT